MCGIIFADLDGRARKRVMKRYQAQQNRGKEGYGAISISNGFIQYVYRSTEEGGIKNSLKEDDSKTILFHHRKPTSTPNLEEATHPILVSNDKLKYNYYVVHNGVISNAGVLKKRFEDEGYEYNTIIEKYVKPKGGEAKMISEVFNDSESFAIDIVQVIEGSKNYISSLGSIAFVAIQYDKDTAEVIDVFFGRNYGNPLQMDLGDGFMLASEGKGQEVEANMLFVYNLKTRKIKQKPLHMGVKPAVAAPYTPPVKKEDVTIHILPKNSSVPSEKFYDIKIVNTEGDKTFYHQEKGMLNMHFMVHGGKLFRTSIPELNLPFMLDLDWEVYYDLTTKFNFNVDIYQSMSEGNITVSQKEKDEMGQSMKEIRMGFTLLSESVNSRSAILEKNKS